MNKSVPRKEVIHIEGVGPVLLERSQKAKRMNISVRPFKGVRVAVPKRISFRKAEQLARSRSEWLKSSVLKMQEYEKICEQASANAILLDRREAHEILAARLAKIARRHGYKYNRVSVRNQKTRWGSCSAKNNISLNIKLTLLPDDLCDYILLHELVHTKVKNHGPDFWAEMLRVEPDARALDKRVNQYDLRLLATILVRKAG